MASSLILLGSTFILWLPRCHNGKESTCQCRRHTRLGFYSWVRKIPWSWKWQLAWKIPRTEETHGLLAMGPPRVRHDWATKHTHKHTLILYLILAVCHISFVLILDLELMSVPHGPASWRWRNALRGFPVESASKAWLVCEVLFVLLWGSNLGDGWAMQNFLLRCILTFTSFLFSLLFFNIHFYLFVCAGIFSCCMWALSWGLWDLVPWTGIKQFPKLWSQFSHLQIVDNNDTYFIELWWGLVAVYV